MDVLGRAGAQLRQDPEAAADGVAMRELVEGAVSALHQLANDPSIANIMLRDHPFIEMLIKVVLEIICFDCSFYIFASLNLIFFFHAFHNRNYFLI